MISSKIARTAFFLLVIGTLSMAGQTAPQAAAPAEGETVHVLVGKSIVINVEKPLTRVLSSNPAAVETMATSPTQVVIEGKAAGASSLILWDESGRSEVFDVVTDVDIAGLRSAIQKTYPREHLDVEADGGRLLLTGTASNAHIAENLGKMAGSYSKDVVNSILVPIVHERQVMLARETAGHVETIGLHGFDGDTGQARHFSRMRGQHQRPLAAVEQLGVAVEGVEPIGVEDDRDLGLAHSFADELHGFRIAADARTESHHIHRLHQFLESPALDGVHGDAAAFGFS